MSYQLPIELLERVSKAPTTFPAWILREAMQELVDRRRDIPSPLTTDVLITFVDPEDGEGNGRVLLVCPRPDCLTEDGIRETDLAERWNWLEFHVDSDQLSAADAGPGHFEHTGFVCEGCGWPVTLPQEFAANIAWT